ncbi:NAD(P)-dependent oxidoreductase [Devosia sp. FJ2-5-3]|jgi:NAD+ dependent glucose-6-phosphate dehydrogenase|uniref:NAD-dependent epimerase/dehydratase family protein n=1 Tax=Devosia sp. FJ2-5-3 TaxID=2976680 RepID=UPI0023D7E605|nr:NAD(P)-dependent oxidoreductase [Devosia sp. FJ2-5-3]WEJ59697.1 NAD(P)-dependent oxidoreductase [Devosia sp. FJ2-5-3]
MARILLTGAAGNLGGKLIAHWRDTSEHELVLLDRRAGEGIHEADISAFGPEWTRLFDGVDAVIHLAGDIRPVAKWEEVHPANVVGTANVLRAAREAGVRRVAFASTNQVMGGYRFRTEAIRSDSPPLPLNPYAVSKLIGEEMGRAFAAESGADFLAFRIGNIWPGDNLAGPDLGIGSWGQEMWLSNRDFCHAMDCAETAAPLGFGIFNLVSDNPGMRWDIEPARQLLGYRPQDGHAPVFTEKVKAEDERARAAVLVPGSWLDQHSHRLDI